MNTQTLSLDAEILAEEQRIEDMDAQAYFEAFAMDYMDADVGYFWLEYAKRLTIKNN